MCIFYFALFYPIIFTIFRAESILQKVPEKLKRQLAAIMFTDIVGYTALMQTEESKARQQLEKFRNVLDKMVEEYDGNIVNYYGDGCLCTFDSAVNAMNCAKKVQRIFQEIPKVPARIGLHSGDVFFEAENVYGDSVNIASRIESLGVPGSILFSKTIKRHIRNQTEFEIQSLGLFDFKNVDNTMEVFALANQGFAIPKREQMKGKLKTSEPKKAQKRNYLAWFALMIFILIAGYSGQQYFSNSENVISTEVIRNSKIAVLPFENKTNNDEFDVVGDMASDWITKGLMETGKLTVLSPQTVKNRISVAQAGASGNSGTLGVDLILGGKYYIHENDIIVHCQIVNAETQEVLHAFDEQRGPKEDAVEIMESLVQRILGYWLIKDDPSLRKPPNYKAYKNYIEGYLYWLAVDNKKAEELLTEAYRMDTTFLNPLYALMFVYSNQGRPDLIDKMVQIMAPRKNEMSEIQLLLFKNWQADVNGQMQKVSTYYKKLCELDPTNADFNQDLAFYQLVYDNNPNEAIKTIDNFDDRYINYEKCTGCDWRFRWLAMAYLRLGNYEKVLSIVDSLPIELRDDWLAAIELKALLRMHSFERFERKLDSYKTVDFTTGSYDRILFFIFSDLKLLNHEKLLKKYVNELLTSNEKNENPYFDFLLAYAYLFSENYEKAIENFSKYTTDPYQPVRHLSTQNIAYSQFQSGNQVELSAFLKNLQTQNQKYEYGLVPYTFAIVEASRGNKQEAVNLLKEAIQKGEIFSSFLFNYDFRLEPLFGYPPFEALVKLKE